MPGCSSFQGKQCRGAGRLSFTPHNRKGVPPRDRGGDIQKLPTSHSQYVGEEIEGLWKVDVRMVETTTVMVHELQGDRVVLVVMSAEADPLIRVTGDVGALRRDLPGLVLVVFGAAARFGERMLVP